MTTTTLTLTDFLLARIAEDERDVHAAVRMAEQWCWGDSARVLAECEAKRRIVERCNEILAVDWWEYDDAPNLAYDTLEFLALPFADHPDYRENWRP